MADAARYLDLGQLAAHGACLDLPRSSRIKLEAKISMIKLSNDRTGSTKQLGKLADIDCLTLPPSSNGETIQECWNDLRRRQFLAVLDRIYAMPTSHLERFQPQQHWQIFDLITPTYGCDSNTCAGLEGPTMAASGSVAQFASLDPNASSSPWGATINSTSRRRSSVAPGRGSEFLPDHILVELHTWEYPRTSKHSKDWVKTIIDLVRDIDAMGYSFAFQERTIGCVACFEYVLVRDRPSTINPKGNLKNWTES
ncbi:hypothetical protein SELMODRAFT_424173 [Selaginella moellendorffii]|uniref:Uncharacterized protein n=1 Tax=Selaginella moellendorffii TaxID=88036 RepID=D8SP21_SELML|nr:hypothetical protein SELMODRAFT_424173 [Selaginella moellendorffii]